MGKSIREHRREAATRHAVPTNQDHDWPVIGESPLVPEDYSWNPRARNQRGTTDRATVILVSVVIALVAMLIYFATLTAQNIADFEENQERRPYMDQSGVVHVPQPPVVKWRSTTDEPVRTIEEDDPRWNCLTMGDLRCGPLWKPANRVIDGHHDCLWRIGDTTWVACPDGYVTTS